LQPKPNGKTDQIPLDCHNGYYASYTNPKTWSPFEDAVKFNADGIGFSLINENGIVIIDIDPSMPKADALAIINQLDSYTEISQSGEGFHIICFGSIPASISPSKDIQFFKSNHYVMLTGNVFQNRHKINNRQELLTEYYNFYKSQQTPRNIFITGKSEMQPEGSKSNASTDEALIDKPQTESDDVVIDRACNAANGEKFKALACGEWRQLNYPSQSEADYALLSMLCFYTRNNEQVRRIFRMTELGKRDKATRNDIYLNRSIQRIRASQLRDIDFTNFNKHHNIGQKRAA
jgi:primase-polymerase (primpol)-like protein